jgi:hypothetical protein
MCDLARWRERAFRNISAYIILHRLQLPASTLFPPISFRLHITNLLQSPFLFIIPFFIYTKTILSISLELDPFTLEIEPLGLEVAPPGGPTWLDTATEISIEELFEVPSWSVDHLTPKVHSVQPCSSSDEMAEDLVVNDIRRLHSDHFC